MEDRRHLLISDLDGTLLGDDAALEEFADWYERRRDRLRLVYSSGRLFHSIVNAIETTRLPAPEAVIAGVGTDIRSFADGRPIGEWPVGRDGWQPLRICSILSACDGLELQPREVLSEFKISYYAHDAPPRLLAELREQLRDVGCDVELVYSSGRDLDVLPRGVNKGSAAAYLAAQWRLPDERVVVSGDTGNDLAMFHAGYRGIVVANAHPELRALKSPHVFQARRTFAGGVLEGLRHWLEGEPEDRPGGRGWTEGKPPTNGPLSLKRAGASQSLQSRPPGR